MIKRDQVKFLCKYLFLICEGSSTCCLWVQRETFVGIGEDLCQMLPNSLTYNITWVRKSSQRKNSELRGIFINNMSLPIITRNLIFSKSKMSWYVTNLQTQSSYHQHSALWNYSSIILTPATAMSSYWAI